MLVRKLEETNVELLDVNEALWESEERLRLAASAGNIGMWEWNPTTDQLVWSEQQKLLFGWPTDREALTFQQFLSAIEPQDRDRIQNALQTALANRSGYELEYRVFWPDGSLHWIAGRGRGDYDEAGRCLRMRGIALDITPAQASGSRAAKNPGADSRPARDRHGDQLELGSANDPRHALGKDRSVYPLFLGKRRKTAE